MAGIYVHIPFCKSRCIYCGFYSTTGMDKRQQYVDAVCKEMEMRRSDLNEHIHTIYIGGGTPSQLSIPQLRQLLEAIGGQPKEVTIECNPDDVTQEYADAFVSLHVNRISIGAQTFDDQRLRFLHRRHSARQVTEAVEQLRKAGIQNISIDLMYGFPNETLDDWQRDIDNALALDIEHLSAYCLTIEEGTPLAQMIANSNIAPADYPAGSIPDEEIERSMYYTLINRLTAVGYEHYEISNFAKPGYRSRHNSSYWTDIPYIGLGAAAHSYDGHHRQWNVSDLTLYIKGIESGHPDVEREIIDDITRYNDRVMLSLRTCEGLNLSTLSEKEKRYILSQAQKHISNGLLIRQDNHIVLSHKGLFVSDMVICDLMIV